jgi:hypothetical protein
LTLSDALPLDDEEASESRAALVRMVAAGKASGELLEAFDVVVAHEREQRRRREARLRREWEADGSDAVYERLSRESADRATWYAYSLVHEGYGRSRPTQGGTMVQAARAPRSRPRAPRSRPRSTRSRASPSSSSADDDSHDVEPAPGRARPALAITLALEGRPSVRLCAESYEDEMRLKVWLARSGWIEALVEDLEALRDLLEPEAE